jgi:hypothetical protein
MERSSTSLLLHLSISLITVSSLNLVHLRPSVCRVPQKLDKIGFILLVGLEWTGWSRSLARLVESLA